MKNKIINHEQLIKLFDMSHNISLDPFFPVVRCAILEKKMIDN